MTGLPRGRVSQGSTWYVAFSFEGVRVDLPARGCTTSVASCPPRLSFRVGGLDVAERRQRYTNSRKEEEADAHMRPCGKAIQTIVHTVGECGKYKEERGVLEERRKLDERDMEKFGALE